MTTCILDGEIVALGEDGRPSFSRLQHRMHVADRREAQRRAAAEPVTFVAFDLLYLDGHSMASEPYDVRRDRLESLGLSGPGFTTTDSFRDLQAPTSWPPPCTTGSRASWPSVAFGPVPPRTPQSRIGSR